MQHSLLSLLVPHYCCSCGSIGSLMCQYCKYDIINEPYEACIVCHKLAKPTENLCSQCKVPFTRAWCAGDRREGLKVLINTFKFERARAAHLPLVDIIHHSLPSLPPDTQIVPVPTIAPHIRVRGYDQTALLARRFAKLRGLPYTSVLRRTTNTMQRGASRKQRIEQAKRTFSAQGCSGVYMVIDDITTTGATLQYAAQALLDAGAHEVWVAVIACQPLEK